MRVPPILTAVRATLVERGVHAAAARTTSGPLELSTASVAGGRLCGLKAALRGRGVHAAETWTTPGAPEFSTAFVSRGRLCGLKAALLSPAGGALKPLAWLLISLLTSALPGVAGSRVKDIAMIAGARENQLVGYGRSSAWRVTVTRTLPTRCSRWPTCCNATASTSPRSHSRPRTSRP